MEVISNLQIYHWNLYVFAPVCPSIVLLNLFKSNFRLHLMGFHCSHEKATKAAILVPSSWSQSLPTKLHLWPISTQLWPKEGGLPSVRPKNGVDQKPASHGGLAATSSVPPHKHSKIHSSPTTQKAPSAHNTNCKVSFCTFQVSTNNGFWSLSSSFHSEMGDIDFVCLI